MIREDVLSSCVLESIKSHIGNIVSLDSSLRNVSGEAPIKKLANQYEAQIIENERRLEEIGGFKSKLYENMITGYVSKEDYKTLKSQYTEDVARLSHAVASLRQALSDLLSGKGGRLHWIEHFKRFDGLTELDRKTVAYLIQSIRVISKSELQMTFNYQPEFDKICALCETEAA
jgi:ribosomal protein S17E